MGTMTERTVKEIVTEDHRTAAVFERHAIDFCCNGGRRLGDACKEKGVDPQVLLQDLEQVAASPLTDAFRPAEWDLDALADFIVNTHHRYVRRTLPVLLPHVEKVLSVHGKNHPELAGIAETVDAIAAELAGHMQKEELILFPAIKALAGSQRDRTASPRLPFGSIRNPIEQMEAEHRSVGDSLASIRTATQNYTPPPDACTTFMVTYKELADFERDLHQHIHLENNILFPRAIVLEESLSGSGR